jgi:predicted nucleotidyltransferase component of viral defense system
MITTTELLEIGRLKGMRNRGYMEKDYLLELILFSLSKNTKEELVFKGGTALYKFYKLERFSEDLDFSETKTFDLNQVIKKIFSDLSKFNIDGEVSKVREPFHSVLITFRIKGPLYDGQSQTFSTIRVDINRKSIFELQPLRLRLASLYTEIPPFYVLVMQEKEILAEKIRALIMRNKARDLFDTFSLIEKGIEIDDQLIKKKMSYYEMHYTKTLLKEAIGKKEHIWDIELKPLLDTLPSFSTVAKKVLSKSSISQRA